MNTANISTFSSLRIFPTIVMTRAIVFILDRVRLPSLGLVAGIALVASAIPLRRSRPNRSSSPPLFTSMVAWDVLLSVANAASALLLAGEWYYCGNDAGGSRYSLAERINTSKVNNSKRGRLFLSLNCLHA